MAALNSLTSKLNQLQKSKMSPEPKKSLWRTNEPEFPRTSFADKFASIFATASPTAAPTYVPTYAPTHAATTTPPTPEQFNYQPSLSYRNSFGRTVPPKTTTTTPTPQTIIITQPPIDVDSLKIEMSDFAAEAARAHAKAVGENISAEQEKLQKEVDRVLELVQGLDLFIFILCFMMWKFFDDFLNYNFEFLTKSKPFVLISMTRLRLRVTI